MFSFKHKPNYTDTKRNNFSIYLEQRCLVKFKFAHLIQEFPALCTVYICDYMVKSRCWWQIWIEQSGTSKHMFNMKRLLGFKKLEK